MKIVKVTDLERQLCVKMLQESLGITALCIYETKAEPEDKWYWGKFRSVNLELKKKLRSQFKNGFQK